MFYFLISIMLLIFYFIEKTLEKKQIEINKRQIERKLDRVYRNGVLDGLQLAYWKTEEGQAKLKLKQGESKEFTLEFIKRVEKRERDKTWSL